MKGEPGEVNMEAAQPLMGKLKAAVLADMISGSICYEAEINNLSDIELTEGLEAWINIDPFMVDVIVEEQMEELELDERPLHSDNDEEAGDPGFVELIETAEKETKQSPITTIQLDHLYNLIRDDNRISLESKTSFQKALNSVKNDILLSKRNLGVQKSIHKFFVANTQKKDPPRTNELIIDVSGNWSTGIKDFPMKIDAL